jgi:uncharacterized metal-binding protein YceD (DUF177 family)
MSEINEILRLDRMQSGPRRQSRAVTAEECEAVADRLELRAVRSINFNLEVEQTPDRDIYEVIGQAEMTAERVCTVTNDPFDEITQTAIHELFTPNPKKATSEDADVDADLDALDVELLDEEAIDLGELVVQYLAMELEQSPRSPQAMSPEERAGAEGAAVLGPDRILPFAGLADMLRGGDSDDSGSKH